MIMAEFDTAISTGAYWRDRGRCSLAAAAPVPEPAAVPSAAAAVVSEPVAVPSHAAGSLHPAAAAAADALGLQHRALAGSPVS